MIQKKETSKQTEEKQPFTFSVDSALLSELGEKLVTTVQVALAELVKNAYDADARNVTVKIIPEHRGAPRVVVQDDGVGMSLDQVQKFWMKIGTVHKTDEPKTELFGRLKTGSKGIGRFACRRLGMHLKLTTTADTKQKEGRYQTTTITFNWDEFVAGTDVAVVQCTGDIELSLKGRAGTTLEIWGGATDEWATRGFNYLQRQLALLASNRGVERKGFTPDPGFNVILDAPGLSEGPIDIRSTIIDATWGTLDAKVGDDGRVELALNAKGLGGTKRFRSKEKFKQIVGASLKIGILPTRKEEARKPEILAAYVLTDLVNEWGGIHVKHNGFRVVPYGDAGDDWLQIDADRGRRVGKPEGELFDFASRLEKVDAMRALLNMLGMRNYLGQVELSSEIKGLTPRIDRQGFLDNSVFDEVRRFTRFAVDWANIYRDHYIRLREASESQKAHAEIRSVLDIDAPPDELVPRAVTFLKSEIKRIVQRLPASQQRETEQVLIRTVKAIEAVNDASTKQLEHLRLVASASTLTLLFAHEVRTIIGGLGATALRLNQLAKAIPSKQKELGDLSLQVSATKDRFDNLVGMTGIVGSFRGARSLEDIHLLAAVERSKQCFQLLARNYDVQIDIDNVSSDITVGPMIQGELYTILLNVLSNSIKSVIAAAGSSRKIDVTARQSGDKIIITVSDTGLGLSPDFFEEVFTAFISDPSGTLYDALEQNSNPEDASIFGTGSGLGLPIARDIARARGGDIRFIDPPSPWRATVEIELP